jgi:hypothetical protein
MDRIWIKLSDQNHLLPAFWNFKLNLLDIIGTEAPSVSIPKLPQSYGLHLLGAIWFYTLLGNSKQDISQVYMGVGEAAEKVDTEADITFIKYLETAVPPVFSPENIFWNPGIGAVNEAWHTFWKDSLCFGFQLFEASLRDPKGWSQNEFSKDLENLRQQIRESLFLPEPSAPTTKPAPEDAAISNILNKIMNIWREGIEVPSEELETPVISTEAEDFQAEGQAARDIQADADLDTCIILSPECETPEKPPGIDAEADLDETVIMGVTHEAPVERAEDVTQEDDDIDETIMLSPDVSATETAPPAAMEDDLDKTILLTPEPQKPADLAKDVQHKDDDLDETVILGGPPETPVQIADDISHENDDIDETIILSPDVPATEAAPSAAVEDALDKATILTPEQPEPPDSADNFHGKEDDLDETVILSPDTAKKDTATPDQAPADENKKTETPDPDPDEFLDETIIIQPDKTGPDKT